MVPTVKIHDPYERGRHLIINSSAFDPRKHTLFSEPLPPEPDKTQSQEPPVPEPSSDPAKPSRKR